MKYILRQGSLDDFGFVFNFWIQSLKQRLKCNYFSGENDNLKELLHPFYRSVVQNLVNKSKIIVASDPTNTTVNYGFIVYDELNDWGVVHYVFVKTEFRKLGIAKKLYSIITQKYKNVAVTFKTVMKLPKTFTYIPDLKFISEVKPCQKLKSEPKALI